MSAMLCNFFQDVLSSQCTLGIKDVVAPSISFRTVHSCAQFTYMCVRAGTLRAFWYKSKISRGSKSGKTYALNKLTGHNLNLINVLKAISRTTWYSRNWCDHFTPRTFNSSKKINQPVYVRRARNPPVEIIRSTVPIRSTGPIAGSARLKIR
jgi:hypothetical protein